LSREDRIRAATGAAAIAFEGHNDFNR
jgi:hypothetical protein